MSKPLVIVESPTKVKTISKILGSEYIVKSSVGHIRDLPRNSKSIPSQFDSKKILTDLGWKTKVEFKKGLEKTFLWYLENQNYYKSIPKKDIVKRIGKL